MTVDKYTLVKMIIELDDNESDFSDPDAEPTEAAIGAINLAAKLLGVKFQEVRDDLTDAAAENEDHQQAEEKLQYGQLNQHNEFPHEAAPD